MYTYIYILYDPGIVVPHLIPHRQDMSKDKRSIQKLRREVEKTKRALSSTHQARRLVTSFDDIWEWHMERKGSM